MFDKKKYFKLIGSRIRSELNDLKRTPESAAFELNFEISELNKILDGTSSKKEINALINKMGDFYPIDVSDLYIPEDDCSNGVKIMTTMLEQAIVDAEQLREAALKSAQQEIVEKYSDEVRDAVTKLLEQEESVVEMPNEDVSALSTNSKRFKKA